VTEEAVTRLRTRIDSLSDEVERLRARVERLEVLKKAWMARAHNRGFRLRKNPPTPRYRTCADCGERCRGRVRCAVCFEALRVTA
jgi:hypothetical protein